MADGDWTVATAKARFSEVLDKARRVGPQHVSRNGKAAAVVVSAEQWNALEGPRRSVVDVLLDPTYRGLIEPDESTLFARDHGEARQPPSF